MTTLRQAARALLDVLHAFQIEDVELDAKQRDLETALANPGTVFEKPWARKPYAIGPVRFMRDGECFAEDLEIHIRHGMAEVATFLEALHFQAFDSPRMTRDAFATRLENLRVALSKGQGTAQMKVIFHTGEQMLATITRAPDA